MPNHESMDFCYVMFSSLSLSFFHSFHILSSSPPQHHIHSALDPQKIILLTEIAGNFFFSSLFSFSTLTRESREANHVGRVSVHCLRMLCKEEERGRNMKK